MTHEERLAALGLALPPLPKPAFDYVPAVVERGLVWVSGQLPRDAEGNLPVLGRLGDDVDVEAGRRAAALCALQGLAALRSVAGSLDAVARVVKVTGFVASAPGFAEQPRVIDAASNLMGQVFGEAGRHARSAVGVAMLPRNVPVEIEFVFALRDEG
ncbi:Enamine deaminase RidA, house cleaning of reactive enamine intermediates, YjgF/YER057c/UK114 family [Roseomonas rosea]|uniref:Enamine deaminase RidA, house cleaning of reactive enamine intermediates, YjgF/YER057c/UK114 family n=1 Tax=Muricoccus roseus TaxID=198092 RepID=A0A1M6N0K4_9PROT|nr:RidA family protein [Roseomonas rosea]SHJ89267.1 Enamine deaminase RidA, house cleaning of reactive enamine intermediates, YjgF/YER057c/UK114 family [Roseomonas rosea]